MLDKLISLPPGPLPIYEPRTVLVVEDEVLVRTMVAEELRGRGFNIIEAQNAHEALTLLQSRVPVDLVFSDVQLPGAIDGLILARLVRKMRPELKIILASGHLVSGSSLEGADAFFSKPYDLGRVLTQIEQLLGGLHR